MKHARQDYNRIQDPTNEIPENEPVFLLRGKDRCAPFAIEAWCEKAKEIGAQDNIIEAARNQAEVMRKMAI